MNEGTKDYQIKMKKAAGKKDHVEVAFNGNLGISNANAIKAELTDLKVSGSALTLSFEYLDELDLSFIQIVISWVGNHTANQRTIAYNWNISSELKQLIQNAGFGQILQISQA